MTTKEHLEKIKTKCQELLAIAEKRTIGDWKFDQDVIFAPKEPAADIVCEEPSLARSRQKWDNNAEFIISCAGPAEAGWRATIAAIDDCKPQPMPEGYCHPDNLVMCENTQLIHAIIAAWPEEIL